MAGFSFTSSMLCGGRLVKVELPDQSYHVITEQPIGGIDDMPWCDGLEAVTAWLVAQGHHVTTSSRVRRT